MSALFMIGKLKNCCPTLDDNAYHIRGWHRYEEKNLLFENENAECPVCACGHDVKRCPYIHPLNRQQEESRTFIGASCRWCHRKHLGILCSHRKST